MMENAEHLMLHLHFWFQGTKATLQYTCIYWIGAAGNPER